MRENFVENQSSVDLGLIDKMKQETISHLDVILNTMCMMVNIKYDRENMKKDGWYMKHQWDEETENKFKDWFVNYIHKIKQAQRELYGRSYMTKKDCELAASMFLLSYGWEIKTKWNTK